MGTDIGLDRLAAAPLGHAKAEEIGGGALGNAVTVAAKTFF